MSSIQERVKRLILDLEMTQASFASSIDTHQSVLSRALKEGQTFGEALINKILLAYDNVNKEWLIDGKGEMFKSGAINIKGDGNISNTGYTGGNYTSFVNERNNEGYILSDEGEEFIIPAGLPKEIYPKINQLLARLKRLEADNEQLRKDKAILQDFVTMLNVNKK